MTTSTWADIPDRNHVFKGDEVYWLCQVWNDLTPGDQVSVTSGWDGPADNDDEVQFDGKGYIGREYLSKRGPVPLDVPPSLDPDDLERWLTS